MAARFGGGSDYLEQIARSSVDNTRHLEIHRLLTPATVARWRMLHAPPGREFILNDRGWARWRARGDAGDSLLFPLSPSRALWLSTGVARIVLFHSLGGWRAGTQALTMDEEDMDQACLAITRFAFREIYGSSDGLLKSVDVAEPVSDVEEPMVLAPHGQLRIPGEFDWHRLAGFVASNSKPDRLLDPSLDIDGLASCPHVPPLVIGLNLGSSHTSGIMLVKDDRFGEAIYLSTFLGAFFAAGCPVDKVAWSLEAPFWMWDALRLQAEGVPPIRENWGYPNVVNFDTPQPAVATP